jgi:NADH-quinone oxidoreductase subunit M
MSILLAIVVFLPLLAGVTLFLTPRLHYRVARWAALGTVLATLLLTLILLVAFRKDVEGPQFTNLASGGYGWSWLEFPNIRFALGLDGISLFLFALTTILMITSVCSSWESVKERAPAHYGMMLALESGLLGLFASLDIVLFYIFFEFTLVPLFFLIGIYGGPERRRASITFFLYTLAGGLLTLLGVIFLVIVNYLHGADHVLTFSIPELTRGLAAMTWSEWGKIEWTSPQVLIFLLLFAGFAIKVPLFPFHTWLPLAHVEAPTAGSVLLAGVLLKVGAYGFLRFSLAMTPLGAQALFPLLASISVIGIIYGALTALAQTDVKRLVAYSSVSHMGFVALGMFSFTPTGLDGSLIQMINHGISTGALFACVGVIYERYHTREMDELSGLWARLPLLAFFFILTALSSAALPGLNGFVGEFPILVGMFSKNRPAGLLGALGMILGAYYLLLMLQRVIFGPLREPDGSGLQAHAPGAIRPVGWHEVLGLAPLMVLIVAIGVYPRPLFERMRPALMPITTRLAAAGVALEMQAAARSAPPPMRVFIPTKDRR